MIDLLSATRDSVDAAGNASIHDCPSLLESAVEMMARLSGRLANLRGGEREMVASQARGLQTRLHVLERSLNRSYAIVANFSLQSGVTSQEYSPRGLSHSSGETSLFTTKL
jgi:hypothetical protein